MAKSDSFGDWESVPIGYSTLTSLRVRIICLDQSTTEGAISKTKKASEKSDFSTGRGIHGIDWNQNDCLLRIIMEEF